MFLLYFLFILLVGLTVVAFAYKFSTKPAVERTDFVAYATLGVLLGFLIGMSESPLVAGVVTGGFTIAGVLLGHLWGQSATTTETKREVKSEGVTETTTTTTTEKAKSPFSTEWLFSVSAGILVGAIVGFSVRVNSLLDFRDHSLRGKLKADFTEPQIREIMNRAAKEFTFKDLQSYKTSEGAAGFRSLEPNLGATPVNEPPEAEPDFPWTQYFGETMKDKDPTYIVNNLLEPNNARKVPKSIRTLIECKRLEKNGKSPADIDAEIVRDLKNCFAKEPNNAS